MLRYNAMVGTLIKLIMELESVEEGKIKFVRNMKYRKLIRNSKKSIKQNISKKSIFSTEDVVAFAQFMQSAENMYHLKPITSDDCFSYRYFIARHSNDYGGNSCYGEISFTIQYSEYQKLRATISGWVEATIHATSYSVTDMKCLWNVFISNSDRGYMEYNPEMEFSYSKTTAELQPNSGNSPIVNEFISITNKMLYNIFYIGIERVYDSLKVRYIK